MNSKIKKIQKSGKQQCQRCLKHGHWTYECKNDVAYLYRPSKTLQLKEKSMRIPMSYEKPPKVPKAGDGDKTRTFTKDISSDEEEAIKKILENASSDSSSSKSDSESISSSSEEIRKRSRSSSLKKNPKK